MADTLKGVNVLQNELEKAKESLKDVDENIKKLTGRDPNEARNNPRRLLQGNQNVEVRGGRFGPVGSGRGKDAVAGDGPPLAKRRAFGPGTFGRLGLRLESSRRRRDDDSGEEDELSRKPSVQSSVVATPKEQKTRKDCIEEQKTDEKGLARNKRMFGLLLGTLQKFRVEEQQKKDKEVKRQEIEKKLEEQVEKEKEELKKERQELYQERRKRQADLRRLEQKMEIVKQQESWEEYHKHFVNFIRTKTKPLLFYLPAKHNKCSEERLRESCIETEAMIAEKRTAVEEEISSLDKRREANNNQHGQAAGPEEDVPDEEIEDMDVELSSKIIVQDDDEQMKAEIEDEAAGEEKENIPTERAISHNSHPESQMEDVSLSVAITTTTFEQSETSIETNLPSVSEVDGLEVVPQDSLNTSTSVVTESEYVPVVEELEIPVPTTELENDNDEVTETQDQQNLLNEREFEPIYD